MRERATPGDVVVSRQTPPTIGELQIAPGMTVATMPHRQGVVEHLVEAQPFAVLIYTRSERLLREPPARGLTMRYLPARSVSFLPAGLASRWLYASPIFEHDRSLHVLHLRFTSELRSALELSSDQFLYRHTPAADLAVRGLARQMELALRAYQSRGPWGLVAVQSAALASAERFIATNDRAESAATMTARRRRALIDYVESTELSQLSLSGMADVVGLSISHFSRVFKSSTGQTPVRWARARLQASRHGGAP